ncbi:MAG: hypothetical protein HY883_06535 [Deltaproteobacteria bacterium]|nr:hypothetical protein [Deltaproteobacteria bacterium]
MLMEEMRKQGLAIIDSCERRVKTVVSLIQETARLVTEANADVAGMVAQLKDNLARHKGFRKKDFDSLMQGALGRRAGIAKKAGESLNDLMREQVEMMDAFRKVFAGGDVDFERVKKESLSRLKEKETNVAKNLMRLHMEQEELTRTLGIILIKGKDIRIKDFKGIVRALSSKQSEERLDSLLNEFCMAREDVTAKWHGVFSAYSRH